MLGPNSLQGAPNREHPGNSCRIVTAYPLDSVRPGSAGGLIVFLWTSHLPSFNCEQSASRCHGSAASVQGSSLAAGGEE